MNHPELSTFSQFLPLRDFDVVTSALNFGTSDCRVTGGCDLYTTKASGSEKKLYRNIECSLESQHEALIKFGASLSPPQREELAASMNLSRSSPFGPLSDVWSRRTFAYLIATLNASHPDYDFSHVLRPSDFRREKDLRRLMANFDGTLSSVRPISSSLTTSFNNSYTSASPLANTTNLPGSSPVWGPHMWAMIDKEMDLESCSAFSYQPAEDPFDGDEAAIWRMHVFFFNRSKKRVAYLYVRGLPIIVNSPALAPARRGSSGLARRHAPSLLSSSSSNLGASKRAGYWLGDQLANRIVTNDEDDEDEEDAVMWDPDEDVDIDPLNDPDPSTEEESDEYQSSSEESEDDERLPRSRGGSEEIAGRMEIE